VGESGRCATPLRMGRRLGLRRDCRDLWKQARALLGSKAIVDPPDLTCDAAVGAVEAHGTQLGAASEITPYVRLLVHVPAAEEPVGQVP
jgi:hypothetical protein